MSAKARATAPNAKALGVIIRKQASFRYENPVL